MKVAITDYTFAALDVEEEILARAGHELVAWKDKVPASELPRLVADADAVITQFAPVDRSVIASMTRARVIVRYGIGVDNVDLDAAREHKIPVCNVPDYCIDEVADHTLAFILGVTRQVVPHTIRLREGGWGLAGPLERLRTLREQTVGLIGFGRIGRAVARRLAGFGCRILVHDPGFSADVIKEAGYLPASLSTLLEQCDIVSLHCPSTAETRGIIGREAIAQMKPGAILVNLARGDLVDPDALTSALTEGRLAAAALDVFQPEPIPAGHPILALDQVILAPHIASASVTAVRNLRETAAKLALKALNGEPLPNIVNGVV